MRRIGSKLIKDPLLRELAVGLKSLKQAKNELRWIRQELPLSDIQKAVQLRKQHYPLQYILGTQPFLNLDIGCRPGVLIPRWETEEWVSQLATHWQKEAHSVPQILDLCTGTGCVLFGLCHELSDATGMAIDISDEAIALCERNQHELGMENRTKVIKHNIFDTLPPQLRFFNCVVANPPYIHHVNEADIGVRKYEPKLALAETDGIWEALVQRVMETQARIAVFEVGYKSQIDKCTELFAKHNWVCEGRQDSYGKWRTVWAFNTNS